MVFRKRRDLSGKHVFITGGSTGIGLALAMEAIKCKAHVTIAARQKGRLDEAKAQLEQAAQQAQSGSKVSIQVMDVTDVQQVKEGIQAAEKALGPVDTLICSAGASRPGYFHDMDLAVFQQQINLNYYGTLHVIHALYKDMVARNSGHIVIIGSALSLFGLIGYSAYCPSKYAVKGLADCLRNELQGTGVRVSIAVPPDTDTPGFDAENQTKPKETKEISEVGASLFKPEQVAKLLMDGIRLGDYNLATPDPGLQLLNTLVKGLVPRRFPGVLLEMLAGLIGPVAQWAYVAMFDRKAKRYAKERFAPLWAQGNSSAGSAAAAAASSGAEKLLQ